MAILGIEAILNQACAALTLNSSVDTWFVFYYLSHIYEKVREFGYGANQKNLNSGLIRSILVPVPLSLAEQREIEEALRACDAVIAGLEREAALHEDLFWALLEELMTGRVRVGS